MPNVIDVRVDGPNALRREYERDDVAAGRDHRVSDRLHDASNERLVCIFGSGFSEQLPSLTATYVRSIDLPPRLDRGSGRAGLAE